MDKQEPQEVVIKKPTLMSRIKEYALISIVFDVVHFLVAAIIGAFL